MQKNPENCQIENSIPIPCMYQYSDQILNFIRKAVFTNKFWKTSQIDAMKVLITRHIYN